MLVGKQSVKLSFVTPTVTRRALYAEVEFQILNTEFRRGQRASTRDPEYETRIELAVKDLIDGLTRSSKRLQRPTR